VPLEVAIVQGDDLIRFLERPGGIVLGQIDAGQQLPRDDKIRADLNRRLQFQPAPFDIALGKFRAGQIVPQQMVVGALGYQRLQVVRRLVDLIAIAGLRASAPPHRNRVSVWVILRMPESDRRSSGRRHPPATSDRRPYL
jgi:hypothetical protein